MSKWFPMIAKSKMCEFHLFACPAALAHHGGSSLYVQV